MERRLDGLVYDATLLCSEQVYDLVDDAEGELRRLTVFLGLGDRSTNRRALRSEPRLMARQVAARRFPDAP